MSADRLRLITTDPARVGGQAVIVGTRVPVSVALDCLAAGMSVEQIVAESPTLTAGAVPAAAAYGALLVREELVPSEPVGVRVKLTRTCPARPVRCSSPPDTMSTPWLMKTSKVRPIRRSRLPPLPDDC